MRKVKRSIIHIDEKLCNGCGDCILSCPEQAIQIIKTPQGPKARLVKEFYCDGLGACLGACPTGALTIEERVADVYDDEATISRIKEVAPEMLETHRKHIEEHKHKMSPEVCACPSSQTMQWDEQKSKPQGSIKVEPELRQWPVQLHLVSPSAPYFQNADLLIVADCVPFAYANFHQDYLKGKVLAIGCPKLDEVETYVDKIAEIIRVANLKSIKVIHMEVPCCFGLVQIVQEAISKAKKKVPFEKVIIGIKGDVKK